MANVKLRVLKPIGKYAIGDEFEQSETDANILTLLKVAERVETRVLRAPRDDDEPRPLQGRRRQYRRRDLIAEG